jgi:hypothetical protein
MTRDNRFSLLNESTDEEGENNARQTGSSPPPPAKKKSRKSRMKNKKREQVISNSVPGYNDPSNLVNCPRYKAPSTSTSAVPKQKSFTRNVIETPHTRQPSSSTSAVPKQKSFTRNVIQTPHTRQPSLSTSAVAGDISRGNATKTSIAENLGDTPSPGSTSTSSPPLPPPYLQTLVVTDGGSPVSMSKFVNIEIDLRWRDKYTKETVERGMSEARLKDLTPVKQLLGFGINPDVQVSPPESAKSATKIHVDSNYDEFLSAVTKDVEQRMQDKNDKRDKKMREDLQAYFDGLVSYEKEFIKFLWMRIIQDNVYGRMSESLVQGSEPKDWISFAELVNEYADSYEIEILTPADLAHLRNPPDRETANELIHPSYTDLEATKQSWTGLNARLSGDGLEVTRDRYERFYTFATGLAV